jgi:hypothetical protein
MNDDRSPSGRTGVLDIILGALVALSLGDLVTHFHTAAVVLNLGSLARLAVFASTMLFAVLFWLERRELIFRLYSEGSRQPPFPLVAALHLGLIAVLAIALAFAAPETIGWFFGANTMFWAIELVVAVALREFDRQRAVSLIRYASTGCAVFAMLTVWNSIALWGQGGRIVACFLFPLVVVVGMVWRSRAIVLAEGTAARTL